MKFSKFILTGLFLVSTFLSPIWSQSLDAGKTGLAFLRMGVGGRASAMGEAFVAIADDPTSTYWNPAGLVNVRTTQVSFTHTEWIQDITHEFLAFVFPAFKGTLGFSFISNNVGGIEQRVKPSAEPIGTISANDVAFGLTYSRLFGEGWQFGVTAKYLYEKIFIDGAAGLAFDFGLQVRPFDRNLTFALVVQNLGSMGKLQQETITLPTTIRVGAAYKIILESFNAELVIAADGVKVRETDFNGNLGAELKFNDRLAFRLGYQSGFEEKSMSGGFGFHFRRYSFDYGYTPFSSGLGDTHRFSFSVEL